MPVDYDRMRLISEKLKSGMSKTTLAKEVLGISRQRLYEIIADMPKYGIPVPERVVTYKHHCKKCGVRMNEETNTGWCLSCYHEHKGEYIAQRSAKWSKIAKSEVTCPCCGKVFEMINHRISWNRRREINLYCSKKCWTTSVTKHKDETCNEQHDDVGV